MNTRTPNTLSIAVGSGKIGYVFISDGEVRDWGVSITASRSPEAAQAKVLHWIDFYRPKLIVTEKPSIHTRKSGRTIRNIRMIAETAFKSGIHHVEQEHVQHHRNKYEEVDDLVRKYPVLENWRPKPRRPWESEPKATVIFESLALFDQLNS